MKWLIPCILLLAACTTSSEFVDYSTYCGSGEVYQCGDYVRVLGSENLVFKDGVEICRDDPSLPECQSAIHETCELVHECSSLTLCEDPRPEICTLDYRPVCAQVDTGIRCITTPCPSTEERTFSNGCSACANEDVIGYRPGACAEPDVEFGAQLAVCDSAIEGFDLSNYECVDACPAGYDGFGTQIGLFRCIPHMGEEFFEKRSGCLRTTENCACIKVERATDGSDLDLGYRCVEHEEYEEFLIHTSGLCKKDRLGIESCMIA